MNLQEALLEHATGIMPRQLRPADSRYIDDRFDFIEPLPGGRHSGVVWKAIDRENNQTRAIRLFRLHDEALKPRAQILFQNRLMPTIHLRHQGIARTYEVKDLEYGAYLVVMEFVSGTKASMLIDEQQLPSFQDTLRILLALAKSLAYAHDLGVTCCHLGPRTVMLPKMDSPVIVDWGLTVRPNVRVSYHCVAPEVGTSEDARADVYSLGVLGYALLTGRSPFSADTLAGLIEEKNADRPLSASRLMPQIPRRFDTFLERSVRQNPGDRYSSMGALIVDLKRILEDDSEPNRGFGSRNRLFAGRSSIDLPSGRPGPVGA
jgi:serine/threonine-protein kinase